MIFINLMAVRLILQKKWKVNHLFTIKINKKRINTVQPLNYFHLIKRFMKWTFINNPKEIYKLISMLTIWFSISISNRKANQEIKDQIPIKNLVFISMLSLLLSKQKAINYIMLRSNYMEEKRLSLLFNIYNNLCLYDPMKKGQIQKRSLIRNLP